MAIRHLLALLLAFGSATATAQTTPGAPIQFNGTCDASGAIPLGGTRFASIDDEEGPFLRIYDLKGGPPEVRLPLPGISSTKREPDFEAGTIVNGQSLWIGSHGRNSKGEVKTERHVLMAIPLDQIRNKAITGPVREVTTLLEDFRAWAANGKAVLATAIGDTGDPDKKLSPEAEGLNIEAMAYNPKQRRLFIGFRNPVPDGKALIASVSNTEELLADGNVRAAIGEPIRLDLGGRGLRDMAWSPDHGLMFLLAGPKAESGTFALYKWSDGVLTEMPWAAPLPDAFHPEALVPLPGTKDLLVLSDDGDRAMDVTTADCKKDTFENGVCTCKRIKDGRGEALRSFRGIVVRVE